ncbi:MAG: SET domain-containing protein [Chitinophagaceae bacterium]|jgi:SET domain-containing protein
MMLPCITVAPSKNRGKGVFATEKIKANTIIEISPVLVFSEKESRDAEKTLLYNYLFEWGDDVKKRALGLGYISIYNHSYKANCLYEMDFDHQTITIQTIKDIKIGEELFINYNADPNEKKPIWFDAH